MHACMCVCACIHWWESLVGVKWDDFVWYSQSIGYNINWYSHHGIFTIQVFKSWLFIKFLCPLYCTGCMWTCINFIVLLFSLIYNSLYVQWRFKAGIEKQFIALQKGFNEMVSTHLLKSFDEKELELIVSGLGKIDVQDWQTNTRLKNCSPDTEQIKWFWQVRGII